MNWNGEAPETLSLQENFFKTNNLWDWWCFWWWLIIRYYNTSIKKSSTKQDYDLPQSTRKVHSSHLQKHHSPGIFEAHSFEKLTKLRPVRQSASTDFHKWACMRSSINPADLWSRLALRCLSLCCEIFSCPGTWPNDWARSWSEEVMHIQLCHRVPSCHRWRLRVWD